MGKKELIILALGLCLCFPYPAFAETIILKSGRKVEGKIIKKTDKYIQIDFPGVPLTYYLDEIESIEGEASLPNSREHNKDVKSRYQEESQTSEFIHHSNYINEVIAQEMEKNIYDIRAAISIVEKGVRKLESLQAPPCCIDLKSFTIEFWRLMAESFKAQIDGDKERSDSLYNQSMEYQKKAFAENENLKTKFYSPKPEMHKLHDEATLYGEKKEYKKSIELLNKAVNLYPDYFEGYMALSAAYSKVNENDKAIECAFNALRINPSSAWACYRLGAIYIDKEDIGNAQIYTNKALELYPEYALAYVNLATIYYGKGELDKSIAFFKKALSLGLTEKDAGVAQSNIMKIENGR